MNPPRPPGALLELDRAGDLRVSGSLRIWARTTPGFRRELVASRGLPDAPCDPEAALLERYRISGEAFLDGFKGGFAVALHDPGAGRLLLARDGMGSLSLAYALTDRRVAFAFEEEDLERAAGLPGDLDPVRLAEYFANVEVGAPRTFFAGVRVVAPGELLTIEASTMRRRALARPDSGLRIRSGWEEYVERFAEHLRRAVADAVADCDRAAVLLSGGLDSGPIAALAARELGDRRKVPAGTAAVPIPLVGLSWRLRDAEADESKFVTAVAERSGFPVEWIDCDDAEPFSNLADWPAHPATPEQTPYRWFHERSYRRAADLGCQVVLTGFSGDSLYGNARGWAWGLLFDRGPGAAIDRLREVARRVGWPRVIRSELLSPLLPRRRTLRESLPAFLTPEALALLRDRHPYPPGVERFRRPRQARRVLALLDAHGEQVERFYTRPLGVDARYPLRDFELAQFVLATPAHLLQQGSETRPVLRAAISGQVPEEVRLRRGKATFFEIAERGLDRACRTWAPRVLASPDALWGRWVEPAAVRRWLTGPRDRDWDTSGLLQVLFGEIWRLRRAGADLRSFLL